MAPLRFTHIGLGHIICANRVLAIILPATATGRRYSRNARDVEKYIDATVGRKLKSLILMDDGTVIACAVTAKTLARRLSADEYTLDTYGEADDYGEDEYEETEEEEADSDEDD